MSQIFHRSTNTLSRATIFGAVFIIAALGGIIYVVQGSPFVTYAGLRKPQPVPFSHQHHVAGLGIDCR
ncbi:MAG TPA: cytochrome c3 family protein, partial [Candidatus Udaeobacter sp.]|nr:cytochrome c3 family protein [Candidatus Udaeobacter sp.]